MQPSPKAETSNPPLPNFLFFITISSFLRTEWQRLLQEFYFSQPNLNFVARFLCLSTPDHQVLLISLRAALDAESFHDCASRAQRTYGRERVTGAVPAIRIERDYCFSFEVRLVKETLDGRRQLHVP